MTGTPRRLIVQSGQQIGAINIAGMINFSPVNVDAGEQFRTIPVYFTYRLPGERADPDQPAARSGEQL